MDPELLNTIDRAAHDENFGKKRERSRRADTIEQSRCRERTEEEDVAVAMSMVNRALANTRETWGGSSAG